MCVYLIIKMMRNLVFLNSHFPGPNSTDHYKPPLVVLNPMLVWPGLQQLSDWFGIFSRTGHMQLDKYTCLNFDLYDLYLERQISEKTTKLK